MHSILESDGVPSDPYDVLCHMGALIIEGRTPLHISKGTGDCSHAGESATKTPKPYIEGPHVPNFMKVYNKETHNVHKCAENNVLCIRHGNLKQHLLHLHEKSVPICIEVSLGPDCLCGELRSQSTLVSATPSKRDIVLEQWTVTVIHKRSHEPSQMSVMNLYQAVRSLLHFSQLTAWYMSHNGMKPSNVIYRVGVPGDFTFISDDNFIKHDFPVADINKTASIKISLKSLPRMEKIPSVYCPQHSTNLDAAQGQHPEGKDLARLNKEKKYLNPEPLRSKFCNEKKDDLLEPNLPLKFQGVRKKTFETHERKRKKRISFYASPDQLERSPGSDLDFYDGMPPVDSKEMPGKCVYDYYTYSKMIKNKMQCDPQKMGESSSKSPIFSDDLTDLMKPQSSSLKLFECNFFEQKVNPNLDLMIGLQNLTEKRGKETKEDSILKRLTSPGFVSKSCKYKTDILDDRMQISCAISGKHHCNSECDEENDGKLNVEKPKRRRSLSKARVNEEEVKPSSCESEKILHGKFKECDLKTDSETPVGNISKPIFNPDVVPEKINYRKNLGSLTENDKPDESLPLEGNNRSEIDSVSEFESLSESEKSDEEKTEEELSIIEGPSKEDSSEEVTEEKSETLNPFLEAILRTARRSMENNNNNKCDNSQNNNNISSEIIIINNKNDNFNNDDNCDPVDKNLDKSDIFLQKLKKPIKNYITEKMSDFKAKVDVSDKVQSDDGKYPKEGIYRETPKITSNRNNLDLKLERKKSPAVRNLRDLGDDDNAGGGFGPSEFLAKSINRLKSLFDRQDLKSEYCDKESNNNISNNYYNKCNNNSFNYSNEELIDENCCNNVNSTKTIPVPSAQDKLKFRRSLDSAAQLVFHRCSGFPLTSSPAPVRRNHNSFSFDSSLNSVSAIKSALFEPSNSVSSEDENESEGSLRSPASPGAWSNASKPINYHSLSPLPLLGTFEESVLNGRLEPVSTVQGFMAELGASGSFCPRHMPLPVTVFFYTLGDNDKVSAPYLGHINLGKKGYNVPRSGTIQVTLFNPLRTVVKMFVVVYDLHDMPANSHTFLRQRTLYVPANQKESVQVDVKETPYEYHEDYHKYLRYLIHLRFVSGKTGKIYLHTDIRMIIFRKADVDTATALGNQIDGESYELRSHTHGPVNPKFSPRK